MTIDTKTNKFGYQSYTAEVDTGEFLAEVEFCFTPGEPGDRWTPGTGDDYEIIGGFYFLYDEETGEVIRDKQYPLFELSERNMKFVQQEIEKQFTQAHMDDDHDYEVDYRGNILSEDHWDR